MSEEEAALPAKSWKRAWTESQNRRRQESMTRIASPPVLKRWGQQIRDYEAPQGVVEDWSKLSGSIVGRKCSCGCVGGGVEVGDAMDCVKEVALVHRSRCRGRR